MEQLRNKRAIIDRAALAEELAALAQAHGGGSPGHRSALLAALKGANSAGREEIRRRLLNGASGRTAMHAYCFLADQLIRLLYDEVVGRIYRATNPTAGERMSLVATGGYGRGELAPFSDVDLMFLLPYKQTPWGEQVVEFLLYMLWDMGLKVGHATRSVDECLRLSRRDLTIRTAILEARYLWGDQQLFLELKARFEKDLVAGTGPEFVEAKLAERDERHLKLGDSRYVLEPNIKEGKGGLRDLHTLYWIAKYLYRVDEVQALVDQGVLTAAEYRTFRKAEDFLDTVRCHLHDLADRPEERLTFDKQPELAQRLGYTDHAGSSDVERFMKHYFLVAKDVGDLTRIFCATFEEQHRRKRRLRMPRFGLRAREIDGFAVEGDRITIRSVKEFREDPVKLVRLFQVAHEHDLDIHPQALRQIRRDLKLISGRLRRDAEANAAFMAVLTSRRNPEVALRRMNEAGVFGRFVPDFGRVVAQMQMDMYHVYTVDEHTIRAIGVLARIEDGSYAEDHPLSAEVLPKIKMRSVLYVAVLLHDIAKGRGGDHSELGAKVAEKLCPRLGMSGAETETVAWLVRWHLAMSNIAFKRDLDDPKTIQDFVDLVQSPERLRLLLVLTVADIRAVGPGVWNGWKGQLLRSLYYRAEERMLGGHAQEGRAARAAHVREALGRRLADLPPAGREAHLAVGPDSFWLSADEDTHERWARLLIGARDNKALLTLDAEVYPFESATEVTVVTADHPGLFSRLAGAISLSGATIVAARIFTLSDGMALDVFWLQDSIGRPLPRPDVFGRLRRNIELALAGDVVLREALSRRRGRLPERAAVFRVEPQVIVDNEASKTHTVIEVNGRDRPGLLYDLTRAFYDLSLSIAHARIATYGERAVDVFYVKDLFGLKVTQEGKLKAVRERLLQVLQPPAPKAAREAGAAKAAVA